MHVQLASVVSLTEQAVQFGRSVSWTSPNHRTGESKKKKYFGQAINSTEGRKGNSKPPLGEVYKDVEVEEAKGQFFLLLELSALKNTNSQRRFDLLFYSFNRTTFGLVLERGT
ncbi:hypothetical protein YC2023_060798 [Brassica napus]